MATPPPGGGRLTVFTTESDIRLLSTGQHVTALAAGRSVGGRDGIWHVYTWKKLRKKARERER